MRGAPSTTETPWELLVATILSAQCTDAMVNQVTPALFAEFSDTRGPGGAPRTERVEELIQRTGFFRQKTKAILATARAVAQEHGGEVPANMETLAALPGIGRKTANVVLGTAFGVPAIFVDTHVRRLAGRLGLTTNDDPDKIERDLQALLPAPRVDCVRAPADPPRAPSLRGTEAPVQHLPARRALPAGRGDRLGLRPAVDALANARQDRIFGIQTAFSP